MKIWRRFLLFMGFLVVTLVLGGCMQLGVTPSEYTDYTESAEIGFLEGPTGFVPSEDIPEGAELAGKVGTAVGGVHQPVGEMETILEEAGTLDPLAIIGPDNRTRITSTTTYPWRAVVYLEMKFPDSSSTYIGTGFFIGPRTVITSGHCVYDHDLGGWADWVKVIPGSNGSSSSPFGTHYAVNLKTTYGWVYYEFDGWDIGAVILGSDVGESTGWFGFAYYGPNKSIGELVNTAGYPGDKTFRTQWYDYHSIVRVKQTNKMFHNTDTYGGQSGSPLWRIIDGKRYVVGIHRGSRGTYWNQAVWVHSAVFDLMKDWKNNP